MKSKDKLQPNACLKLPPVYAQFADERPTRRWQINAGTTPAGLLPPMTAEEALESAAVHSLAGTFSMEKWSQRAFRSPHHTSSSVALVGGGSTPRPGEISLAHYGVLFLDELPEFSRTVLSKPCANLWKAASFMFPALHGAPNSLRVSNSSPR